MRSSSKRFISILVSALVLIAAIFVYNNFILPAYSEIKDLRANLLSISEAADKQQSAIKQIQNLLQKQQDISGTEKVIGAILPLSQNVASNLNQISSLAAVNNLKLESLSVSKMANKPLSNQKLVKSVGVLRFIFQLSGSYENFKAFLRAAETNIALMNLVDLKIESAQSSKAGGGNFLFSANMEMYYQTE